MKPAAQEVRYIVKFYFGPEEAPNWTLWEVEDNIKYWGKETVLATPLISYRETEFIRHNPRQDLFPKKWFEPGEVNTYFTSAYSFLAAKYLVDRLLLLCEL